MTRMVDLNCDMGESFGAWKMGDDKNVINHISSANVACGFHGGDPRIMEKTVGLAKSLGVGVGAHPGFPDLVGFGRRNIEVSPDEARTDVLYQIGALQGFCKKFGVALQHVKPHGQLNNLAMHDAVLAEAIVKGVKDFDSHLIVVAYGGQLAKVAEREGMRVAYEVFADREYNADGTLVSRRIPGSVITDADRIMRRAVRMVKEGEVESIDGTTLNLKVHTICVHGDTPGAAALVAALRRGFAEEGISVVPMSRILGED